MRLISIFVLAILFSTTAISQDPTETYTNEATRLGYLIDHEGTIYSIARFDGTGGATAGWWMTQNLATKSLPSDPTTPIPFHGAGGVTGIPANDPVNPQVGYPQPGGVLKTDVKDIPNYERSWGMLYNWPAAMGQVIPASGAANMPAEKAQGICPAGWHLPSNLEYKQLEETMALNASHFSNGQTADYAMTGYYSGAMGSVWKSPLVLPNSPQIPNDAFNNQSIAAFYGGFALLRTGHLNRATPTAYGYSGALWCSTASSSSHAWSRSVDVKDGISSGTGSRTALFTVRCKKDEPLDEPNTYLVTGTTTLSIPISKAEAVWDDESWTDDNGVSLLSPKDFGTMNLAAKVVWTDVQTGLVSDGGVQLDGKTIKVTVGAAKGNAVVGLYDTNNPNDMLWSWHIWATEAPTTNTFNDLVWMDRNLGAISATVGDVGSKGNHYQWGRKDPFPNTASVWTDTEPALYDGNGAALSITSAAPGLRNSIYKPLAFITNVDYGADWYASVFSATWENRWGASGKKSVTDPCPEGWRVPNGKRDGNETNPWEKNISVWDGLTEDNSSDAFDKGRNWAEPSAPAGYYPAAGTRNNYNISLSFSGKNCDYWSATPFNNKAQLLFSNYLVVESWTDRNPRSGGLSVRCVQE